MKALKLPPEKKARLLADIRKSHHSLTDLAKRYGVSNSYVHLVKRGGSWETSRRTVAVRNRAFGGRTTGRRPNGPPALRSMLSPLFRDIHAAITRVENGIK